MFHKIRDIKPSSSDYTILVVFESGEQKKYDVRPLLTKFPHFKTLAQTEGLFERVKVDSGGYGISWNDDVDLSCDELYENGVNIFDLKP